MSLPQFSPPRRGLVPTLLVACLFAATLAGNSAQQTQRSLVFLGGPLVFLAGLFARTEAYLHASERIGLLPLPIALVGPDSHARSARADHLVSLAFATLCGLAAIAAATVPHGVSRALWLMADFAWLAAFVSLAESLVWGLGAYYGRRFPKDHPATAAQRALGGGWTQHEAVVHLYGPAIVIGLATAAAMPGQLTLDTLAAGGTIDTDLFALSLGPLVVACALPLVGRALYRRGAFEAIPWLAQATRSLAGPPVPEPAPRWALAIEDPVRRLLVVQFLRATPVPMLRLGLVLGFGVLGVWRAEANAVWFAFGLAAVLAWLLPALRLRTKERPMLERMTAPLPLSGSHVEARDTVTAVLLAAPIVLATVLAGIGMAV